MKHGGGQKLKDRIYSEQGLLSLQCGMEPPESGGWYNKKLTRIEELNAQICAFGDWVAEF